MYVVVMLGAQGTKKVSLVSLNWKGKCNRSQLCTICQNLVKHCERIPCSVFLLKEEKLHSSVLLFSNQSGLTYVCLKWESSVVTLVGTLPYRHIRRPHFIANNNIADNQFFRDSLFGCDKTAWVNTQVKL